MSFVDYNGNKVSVTQTDINRSYAYTSCSKETHKFYILDIQMNSVKLPILLIGVLNTEPYLAIFSLCKTTSIGINYKLVYCSINIVFNISILEKNETTNRVKLKIDIQDFWGSLSVLAPAAFIHSLISSD